MHLLYSHITSVHVPKMHASLCVAVSKICQTSNMIDCNAIQTLLEKCFAHKYVAATMQCCMDVQFVALTFVPAWIENTTTEN